LDDDFALLRMQVEWGADEAIDTDPIDRLRPVGITTAPPQRAVAAPEPAKGTPGERALAAAAQARTLEALRAALTNFDGCALRDTASNLVFAEGDPAATTLIIGEPPGREEDRSGHPFAGPEGQLLDQMLISIGLARAHLMLTPLLPWRPPGGRPPSPGEIAICQPFLNRLVVLLQPSRIVIFGGTAARAVLPQPQSRRRGPPSWVEISIPGMSKTLATLVLPGLSEMLKKLGLRRDAWAGLRMLRRTIDGMPT
jgi:uracil-DNA glycosylase family 4